MKAVKSVLEAKASENLKKELAEQKAKASEQTDEEKDEAIKACSKGKCGCRAD